MIVHTINKLSALSLCEHLIDGDDVVVLLEEGVYLSAQQLPGRILALDIDLAARGVTRLPGHITSVSYDQFVSLCADADNVCAWF